MSKHPKTAPGSEFEIERFETKPRFGVIEAGAGSGKTYNLVRIVREIARQGITTNEAAKPARDISRVLLVTFTQAAALEMRQRMRGLLEKDYAEATKKRDATQQASAALALQQLTRMQISTIHSFCHRAYAEYGPAQGFPPVEGEPRDSDELAKELGNDFWRRCIRRKSSGPQSAKEATEACRWLMSEPDCQLSKQLEDSGIKEFVAGRLDLLRRTGGYLTFDTVIQNLLDALRDRKRGEALKLAIRKDFDACLVDECQDTDSRQAAIFQELFGVGSGRLLLMVGDRNQAIYGFRGANVENYKQAIELADPANRKTLSSNNRSSRDLVELFNSIFLRDAGERFFGSGESIQRIRVPERPDEDPSPETKALLLNAPGGPLRVVDPSGPEAVVSEVARLLLELQETGEAPGLSAKGKQMRSEIPGQATIGVLTRTGHQARTYHKALVNHGIPAALATQSSVFTAPIAPVIHHLLQAVIVPEDSAIRRTLFFAQPRLFGQSGELDDLLARHDAALASWLRDVRELWLDKGLGFAWERLVNTAPEIPAGLVAPRQALASGPLGMRQLADLAHIGEVLCRRSLKLKLTPDALLNHLAERIEKALDNDVSEEDEQIRPETAEPQVVVRTMHTAKGLEYHGVVLPDIGKAEESRRDRGGILRGGKKPVLVSETSGDEPFDKYGDQTLKDNARLLYVALTRAQRKIVILWGNPGRAGEGRKVGFADVLERAGLGSDAATFAESLGVALEEPEALPEVLARLKAAKDVLRQPMLLKGANKAPKVPFQPKGRTSYGDLSKTPEGADPDEKKSGEAKKGPAPETRAGDKTLPFLAFPGGTGPGKALHKVLENVDFRAETAEAREKNRAAIERELRASGIFTRSDRAEMDKLVHAQTDLIAECLPKWSSTPLRGVGAPLSSLDPAEMMKEVRFGLGCRLGQTQANAIADAIKEDHPEGSCLRDIDVNNQAIDGLLIGVIDLVFEHKGKHHILDWKSNMLGKTAADYRGAALEAGILSHHYHLQYTLYAAALHRYMSEMKPNWNYEEEFGGCHYLFLRAFGHAEDAGDFFHKPSLKTVEAVLAAIGNPIAHA